MESQPQSESQRGSVYYEQADCSRYDSLCYAELDGSEAEADVYEYASPEPLDYEVPDETAPEVPEREPVRPPSHSPSILHRKERDAVGRKEKQRLALCKLYTTLTHAHVPSVYSTPSEFRANTAVSESTLDIVNLESSTATPPPTPVREDDSTSLPGKFRSHSRTKVAIMAFILTAIVVGMVSIVVSIVAVLVTREGATGRETAGAMMEDLASLQVEVQQLEMAVEQAGNETSGTINLSSLYMSCDQVTESSKCSPEQGIDEGGFSCLSDPLPLEKQGYLTLDRICYAVGNPNYPITTSLISIDEGASVYCECNVREGVVVSLPAAGNTGLECILKMLRCPLQQTLNVTLNN